MLKQWSARVESERKSRIQTGTQLPPFDWAEAANALKLCYPILDKAITPNPSRPPTSEDEANVKPKVMFCSGWRWLILCVETETQSNTS